MLIIHYDRKILNIYRKLNDQTCWNKILSIYAMEYNGRQYTSNFYIIVISTYYW